MQAGGSAAAIQTGFEDRNMKELLSRTWLDNEHILNLVCLDQLR